MGRLDEASVWVSRALTVEEMDPDAGVSLGDLYAGGQRWDEAKKCYEKVIVKVSHLIIRLIKISSRENDDVVGYTGSTAIYRSFR